MAIADLIGTTIVAGILILMMLGLTASMSETTTTQMLDVTTQQSLSTLASMIEYDFLKMGFGCDPGTAISLMTQNKITFTAGVDTNADGTYDTQDTITYELAGAAVATSTPNPNDCILYRSVGVATPVAVALGVTSFTLQYFDDTGSVTMAPANVKTIKINLTVQSTIPYGNTYAETCWQKRISPRNL